MYMHVPFDNCLLLSVFYQFAPYFLKHDSDFMSQSGPTSCKPKCFANKESTQISNSFFKLHLIAITLSYKNEKRE